ncbi:hypothetical protein EV178_000094 [Coemansia sp. RSA 1646]|nr:hypothetical protein EV178_000094 [Coemansia sp. RSA 1646]KAJ2093207.1 hypothetical protein IW138_000500 [Coemansia sp. RSA 986]
MNQSDSLLGPGTGDNAISLEDINSNRKKRNLDMFLEELKRGQEKRELKQQLRKSKRQGRAAHSDAPSADSGLLTQKRDTKQSAHGTGADDGETTNLYITNIHTDVDEQALCMAFAKHGPIASVKIMWPRTPEEFSRQRNSGFVSFMDREVAASALSDMDGQQFNGLPLRVCWGKRVPLPDEPVFVLDKDNPRRMPPTGHPFNAKMPTNAGNEDDIPEVHVEKPLDHRLVRLIHWTIEHVIAHGPAFELHLISRKADDPRFAFLTDYGLPEHVYYRWRMYSFLNGDTKHKWRDQMFFMHDKGPVWIPPAVTGQSSAADEMTWDHEHVDTMSSEAEEEAERSRGDLRRDTLGKRARDRLQRRVRRVQGAAAQRGAIAEAMAFAIDHAYAASDVVEIVCQSLADQTALPNDKLSKLMLISDILYNCSAPVPNAWRLRQAVEERLDRIFEDLAIAFRGIDARLKAEHFRKTVLAVLAVWEAWMMFPGKDMHKLAAIFL